MHVAVLYETMSPFELCSALHARGLQRPSPPEFEEMTRQLVQDAEMPDGGLDRLSDIEEILYLAAAHFTGGTAAADPLKLAHPTPLGTCVLARG
jgi:hypothetical protein